MCKVFISNIFSGVNIPKIIKIGKFLIELFKNKKDGRFGDTGYNNGYLPLVSSFSHCNLLQKTDEKTSKHVFAFTFFSTIQYTGCA